MDITPAYQALLQPSDDLIRDIRTVAGDIIILGAGGKMGPALARLAKQAVERAGLRKNVIAVSRFSDGSTRDDLQRDGVRTISLDLLDDAQLKSLPDVENVLYLAGMKFGTTGKEPLTWAMNAYLPGRVAEKYKNARIVAFSTGNVYPFYPVNSAGPSEDNATAPVGEYAQSCLARERVFQYFALKNNTPTLIFRLNYANDVSYGVLVDIALAVRDERPIDLTMGYVNVIWQGDANEMALRSLLHCSVPSQVLNITGSETVSVRSAAQKFGALFGKAPRFIGQESDTALLSDASKSHKLLGKPKVSVEQMIATIGVWVKKGMGTLNKPTHFQEREGKF